MSPASRPPRSVRGESNDEEDMPILDVFRKRRGNSNPTENSISGVAFLSSRARGNPLSVNVEQILGDDSERRDDANNCQPSVLYNESTQETIVTIPSQGSVSDAPPVATLRESNTEVLARRAENVDGEREGRSDNPFDGRNEDAGGEHTGENTGRDESTMRIREQGANGQEDGNGGQRDMLVYEGDASSSDSGEETDDSSIIDVEVEEEARMESASNSDKIYKTDWKITPRSAMDLLKVSGRDKGLVGIRKIRTKQLSELEPDHRKLVVRVFRNMVAKLATSMMPEDPKSLVSEATSQLETNSAEKSAIEKCLSVCGKGTHEKRLFRSLAAGIYSAHDAKRIIAKDVRSLKEARSMPASRPLTAERLNETVRGRYEWVRCVRERFKTGNVWRSLKRARNDWEYLSEHGRLPKLRRAPKRVADSTLEECVRFVYCPRNREIMATGTKKVRLRDGEDIVLPQVKRKKTKGVLYSDYQKFKEESPSIRPLKRTSFFEVLSRLTSGRCQMKKCVDYCLGILIYENLAKVEKIIQTCVPDVLLREQLMNQVNAIRDFLKHDFIVLLAERAEDPALNMRHALVGICHGVQDLAGGITGCDDILIPFQVIENVRQAARDEFGTLGGVLEDCGDRIKLFMAHTLRCLVQQSVFKEIDEWLQNKPAETAAIITVDYKQKFIPAKYREKQSDYFGKKGMSWHGSVVTLKPRVDAEVEHRQNEEDARQHVRTNRTRDVNMNHICRNDTDQKALAVASILELVARRTQKDLPTVKEIIVRSDNARNYNNKLIPVIAPFIFKQYGIRMVRYVRSETQDGKGPADLHFARALRYVDKYIESLKKDVVTPKDLCDAINFGDGMSGTVAELYDVEYESPCLKPWIEGMKAKGKLQQIGRVNDIGYTHYDDRDDEIGAYTKAYSYSDKVFWRFETGASECLNHEYSPLDVEEGLSVDENGRQEGAPQNTEVVSNEVGGELAKEILNHPYIRFFSVLQLSESGPTFADPQSNQEQRDQALNELRTVPVLYRGSITGVRLLDTSVISKDSNIIVRTVPLERCPLEDEEDEEEDCGSREQSQDYKQYRKVGTCFVCSRCGQSFTTENCVENHQKVCNVSVQSMVVADRACRIANELICNASVIIYRRASDNPELKKISISDGVRRTWRFPPKWAARTFDGAALGRNFVGPFKEEIRKLVVRGVYDKSKKMSGPQMLEQLEANFPNRFDLPTVYHIRNHVQAVLTIVKKSVAAIRNNETRLPGRKNECVPQEYADVIEEIVTANPRVKPLSVVDLLISKMGIDRDNRPDDFPAPQKIAQKASQVKTMLKKKAATNA